MDLSQEQKAEFVTEMTSIIKKYFSGPDNQSIYALSALDAIQSYSYSLAKSLALNSEESREYIKIVLSKLNLFIDERKDDGKVQI